MNGRHVPAPQGARAIQNPAYRPAGIFSIEKPCSDKALAAVVETSIQAWALRGVKTSLQRERRPRADRAPTRQEGGRPLKPRHISLS